MDQQEESISECWLSSSVCCQTWMDHNRADVHWNSDAERELCFSSVCPFLHIQYLSSSLSYAFITKYSDQLEHVFLFPQVWTTACSSTSRPSSSSRWTGRSCSGWPTRSCCLWACRGSDTRSSCWRPWISSALWSVTPVGVLQVILSYMGSVRLTSVF